MGASSDKRRIAEPLAGLLEASGLGSTPLVVRFPEPLPSHGAELLDSLGVVVEVDPSAPVLSNIRASGRAQKTRRELDNATRGRMRESYYARPDKAHYSKGSSRSVKRVDRRP